MTNLTRRNKLSMDMEVANWVFDPCNMSTIVFECTLPSEYFKFVLKIICLLPFAFLCVFFIKEYIRTQNHVIKSEISFCLSIGVYLILYYWIENAVPYESMEVQDSQIYRFNQIPLFFWFLCQASYVLEIADVLLFLKIPFAKYVKKFVALIKWICVFFVFFVSVCILLPISLDGWFFDGLFQRKKRWDSPVFYFLHSVMIVILSATFILFPRAASMFSLQSRAKMLIAIFLYALSLGIDLIAFEMSHTMAYKYMIFWKNRKAYLYFDVVIRFFYYDFPPLVLSWIVYLLAFPEKTDQEEENIRDLLSQELEITL